MQLAVKLIFLVYLIDCVAYSAPVVIKMDGKKNGKKGGNLILISGGKCGSPTLIKGGKKNKGEMILVGGENCHKEKSHVQVIKQYVPVPYYVPKPIYKYIMRHHYVPVRQVVVKPVPVPYVVKSYKKKPEYSSDAGSSSGYSSGGYESDSNSGLYDAASSSTAYAASSSGNNAVPSVGYGSVNSYIPSEYTNGAGAGGAGAESGNFAGASALSASARMNDVGSLYSGDSDALSGSSGSAASAAAASTSALYANPRGKYSQSVNAAQKHKYYDASQSGYGSSGVASTLSPTMKSPNSMATMNGNLKASSSDNYYYGNGAGQMSYDDYSTAIAAKNGYGMYSPVYSSSNGQLYTSGQMYSPGSSRSAGYLNTTSTLHGGSYPDVSSLYPSSVAGSSHYGMPYASALSSSSSGSSGLATSASSTSTLSAPPPSSYGSSGSSGSSGSGSSSSSTSSYGSHTSSTKKPSKLKLSYSSEGLKKARKLFTDRFTKRNDDEEQILLKEAEEHQSVKLSSKPTQQSDYLGAKSLKSK